MKHLHVVYTSDSGASVELFNGEVQEVTWSDGPAGVRVEGKVASPNSNPGAMNLLEMLAGASRARTEAVAAEKKSSMAAPVPTVVDAEPVAVATE